MNSPQVNTAIRGDKGNDPRRDPRPRPPTTARRSRPSTSASSAAGPTAKEVEICGRYLDVVGNRREAFEDILWSLINSTEFVSRR